MLLVLFSCCILTFFWLLQLNQLMQSAVGWWIRCLRLPHLLEAGESMKTSMECPAALPQLVCVSRLCRSWESSLFWEDNCLKHSVAWSQDRASSLGQSLYSAQTALILEEQGRVMLSLGHSFTLLLQCCMTASHTECILHFAYRGEWQSAKNSGAIKNHSPFKHAKGTEIVACAICSHFLSLIFITFDILGHFLVRNSKSSVFQGKKKNIFCLQLFFRQR